MTDDTFDLITFDCYGTLIDWEQGIINAFQSEAALAGMVLDDDKIIFMEQPPDMELADCKKFVLRL